MAITYSTVLPIKYWEPKYLDGILRIGDRLYRRINSPHYYVLVSDIPDVVTKFGEKYSVQINGEMFGPIGGLLPNGIGQRLDDAIKSMIQESGPMEFGVLVRHLIHQHILDCKVAQHVHY